MKTQTNTAHTMDGRMPWRVQQSPDGHWEIWTKENTEPGSLNNYVVAGEIQFEQEAQMICQAVNHHDTLIAQRDALRDACEQALNIIRGSYPNTAVQLIDALALCEKEGV